MSLYEALDRFVGTGVLACAGLVGAEMPAGTALDGASLSRFLRDRRAGDDFGAVLDMLANEIWLAQDQRGFPQRICETHAAALAELLSEVRLTGGDLAPALESARLALSSGAGMPVAGVAISAGQRIAHAWMLRAEAGGHLKRAGLIEDVARYLLEVLFQRLMDQPRMLSGLKPLLAEYRAGLGGAIAPNLPVAPAPMPSQPLPGSMPPVATLLAAIAPQPPAAPASAQPPPFPALAPGRDTAPPQSPAPPPRPAAAPLPPAATPPASLSAPPAPAAVNGHAAGGIAPAAAPPIARPAQMPAPAAVAEIRSRHRLPEAAMRRLQASLAVQPMPAEQRLARLDELAHWTVTTVAQLRQPANEAPELRRLKTEAAAALEAGELERAMDFLRAVREHLRDGRRRTEARLAEEVAALKSQMIEEAAAVARLGELALARLDLEAAAELFADAAGNLPVGETALELDYRQRQAEALAAKAEMSGDARFLRSAAEAFRTALRLITKAADPVAWARINVGLGDMLMAEGSRDAGATVRLEEAAGAFKEATEAIDRIKHPMRWALVQLSHAAALMEIGARADRERHWKAAATVLMPALEVFESRGATDLAEAARAKLRTLAAGLQGLQAPAPVPALERPAKAG